MIKDTGVFKVGVNDVKEFEVTLMTADDATDALVEAIVTEGADVPMLRVRKYELAKITRVNGELLTPSQVGGLWRGDYEALNEKANDLEKKLLEPTDTAPVQAAQKQK